MFQTADRVKPGQFSSMTMQAFAVTGIMAVRVLTLCKTKNGTNYFMSCKEAELKILGSFPYSARR